MNFSEVVDVESGNIVIYKSSDDSVVETIDVTSNQVTGSGTSQITIDPSVTLDSSTEYYVKIDATALMIHLLILMQESTITPLFLLQQEILPLQL